MIIRLQILEERQPNHNGRSFALCMRVTIRKGSVRKLANIRTWKTYTCTVHEYLNIHSSSMAHIFSVMTGSGQDKCAPPHSRIQHGKVQLTTVAFALLSTDNSAKAKVLHSGVDYYSVTRGCFTTTTCGLSTAK
jgi:hypothetical protein